MKNYFFLFIFFLSVSFQANANLNHCQAEEESSSAINTALSGVNIAWNFLEIATHFRAIHLNPQGPIGHRLYHCLELAGHTGNITNYFDETTWYTTLFLVAFNAYAATVKYHDITRDLKLASTISRIFAVLGAFDFLGHACNALLVPYTFSQKKA
jgi:hypothetical protein